MPSSLISETVLVNNGYHLYFWDTLGESKESENSESSAII